MASQIHTTNPSRRLFLAIAPLATLLGGACTAAAHSLADEFEAAWAAEKTAWADAAMSDEAREPFLRRSRAVVERIIAAPTINLDDVKLKARAYLWCHGGDADAAMWPLDRNAATIDAKLISALMRGLIVASRPA